MNNLTVRVLFALVAIPVVLLCMWGNDYSRLALMSFLCGGGAWEWARMASKMYKGPNMQVVAPVAAVLLAVATALQSGKFFDGLQMNGVVGVAVVLVIAIYVAFAYAKVEIAHLFPWWVLQIGAPLYLGLWGGLTMLLLGSGHGIEHSFLFLLVMTSMWICDSAAYFVGKFLAGKGPFGRHPMAPSLSPKKTWEGAVGGTLFTIGWFYLWTTDCLIQVIDISLAKAVALGIVISVADQAGDLLMSALKRWSGTKDSSQIFPGHGGVLDRMDSFFFAGPIVVLLLDFLK